MKCIEISIKVHASASGNILNELSKLIERYLKRKKVSFNLIDARIKLGENE